ncbi:hypothetical protein LCGC14_1000420 [marine sediment metagenome]|uniref:Uncharacterized protein n=1 Tax=marine sediment metagenome TaxID=412755 RepID=A0A0F9N7Z6_9ZZZZ
MESQQPDPVPANDEVLIEYIDSDTTSNEHFKKSLQQMKTWLSAIYPVSKIDRAMVGYQISGGINIFGQPPTISTRLKTELKIKVRIWTFMNCYYICATMAHDASYDHLECMVSSRRARTGETHGRCNWFPDGKFCQENWEDILTNIVRYEAEEVRSEDWKDKLSRENNWKQWKQRKEKRLECNFL